jgi:hypothetical protein
MDVEREVSEMATLEQFQAILAKRRAAATRQVVGARTDCDAPKPAVIEADITVRTLCHSVLNAAEAQSASPSEWTSPAWTALMLRALPVEQVRTLAVEIQRNADAILTQERQAPQTSAEARRAWIVAQDSYVDALAALDRIGEAWAHNKTGFNRRRFDEAQTRLRDIERRLGEQFDHDVARDETAQ